MTVRVILAAMLCAVIGIVTAADQGSRAKIVFSGNHHAAARSLKVAAARELREFRQHGGAGSLQDAAYVMESHYHDKGYALARVEFILTADKVTFAVDEGPRVRLGEVSFAGLDDAVPFTSKDLRRFFVVREGVFGLGAPLYKRSSVQAARKKVESLFLLAGFLRVKIGEPILTWSKDRSRVDVALHIAPGRRYLVRSVDVSSDDPSVPVPDFGRNYKLTGKPYHVRLPADHAARMRGWLANHGHPDAIVDVTTDVDDAIGAVSLHFRLRPGPLTRLGAVVIRQEPDARTNESFIRGRFRLKSGQRWNQRHVDDGVGRLYRSGLLSNVRAKRQPAADGFDDLVVTANELPAKQLSFGAGWGSYEMLRGSTRYGDRNVFGTGRAWDAGVEASMRSEKADTGFVDAYSFGSNNTLTVRPSFENREEPSFDRRSVNNLVQLEHDFPGPFLLDVGNTYEASRATNIKGEIPEAERAGFLRTSMVYSELRFDTRNNAVMPSSGVLAAARASLSDPVIGSDIAFVEYRAECGFYQALNDNVIGVVGARWITRQILDDNETLPIQQRLFLGGDSTVRSFQQDELGPTDADRDPVGGLSSALASAELRFRIAGNFWGAGFTDLGSVDPNSWNIDWPLGQAYGAGLRYMLPVGPIRLDGAYNPGRRFAADHPWAVHLSVGFTF